jgi:hypothetical protein
MGYGRGANSHIFLAPGASDEGTGEGQDDRGDGCGQKSVNGSGAAAAARVAAGMDAAPLVRHLPLRPLPAGQDTSASVSETSHAKVSL